MKIRRSRPTIEWTQIPNVVARDYRLSWRARGLLTELLSYPPGWETTIDDMVKRARREAAKVGARVEGREAMRSTARELKAAGYLVTTRYQDKRGRWHTDTEVTDAPMWSLLDSSAQTEDGFSGVGVTSTEHDVSAGRTEDGFSGVGAPGVGAPGVPKKKERKKETPPPTEASPARETRVTTEAPQEEGTAHAKNNDEHQEQPGETGEDLTEALAVVDDAAARWAIEHRRPSRAERLRLAVRVREALSVGATPESLRQALTRDLEPAKTRSAVAVVMSRTAHPEWARPVAVAPAKPSLPEWCGECEGSEPGRRMIEHPDGRFGKCPRCHPANVRQPGTLPA